MNADRTDRLKDVAVLIVEDRYLIASDLAEEVRSFGGRVAGIVSSVAKANEVLDADAIDVALLDVNLEGEQIFPLAERLAREGARFMFLTGYDDWQLPEEWRDRPRLPKPVDPRALREIMLKLVS